MCFLNIPNNGMCPDERTGGVRQKFAERFFNRELLEAAADGESDFVQTLLDGNADPNVENSGGWSALTFASWYGRDEVVRKLLAVRADVNVRTHDNGWTPLMVAAKGGCADVVRMLITSKAQLDVQDKEGFTALLFASWYEHVDVAHMLLDAGADVNVKNNVGMTALMFAAASGYENIVQTLLQAGADVALKDNHKSTAADWARLNGHTGIACILTDIVGIENNIQTLTASDWQDCPLDVIKYEIMPFLSK
jgi:ankyrin repeat protein